MDHCILGPIRTRFGGSVETLTITDSIVQGLPATTGPRTPPADIFDPPLLADGLLADGAVPAALRAAMPSAALAALRAYAGEPPAEPAAGSSAGGASGAQRARRRAVAV